MEMRYSLALYRSDLTDSNQKIIPIGVLVVDEKDKKYAFKSLENFQGIAGEDYISRSIWDSLPEILEQEFEGYCENPNHDLYKDLVGRYHGFISQVIEDSVHSSITFSDSEPIERAKDLEQTCNDIFQKKVLRALN
ncbi:MAG: hypothetical protein AABY40_02720 [Nanoarchaeota archaeon]